MKRWGFYIGLGLMITGMLLSVVAMVSTLPWSAMLTAFTQIDFSAQVGIIAAVLLGMGIATIFVTGNS